MEEEMATHSSILAWEIPWTEEPGGYSSWGDKESDVTQQLSIYTFYVYKVYEKFYVSKIIYCYIFYYIRIYLYDS